MTGTIYTQEALISIIVPLICTILFDVLPGFLSAMERIQEQARPE
jgi:hypothetical protein